MFTSPLSRITAIAATSLLFASSGSAASPLPLANPGFEQKLSGWNQRESDNDMSALIPAAARSGKLGLRVTDNDARLGSSLMSDRLRARPGEGYELNFHARLLSGDGIGVYLLFYDANGRVIQPENKFVRSIRGSSANNAWEPMKLYAVAPEQARQLAVWVHSYSTSMVTADFDDFSLSEISAEAALAGIERERTTATRPTQVLPDFPKHAPEQFLAQMKILQPDGSALRKAREDWQGARERIAEDPQWRAWADQQTAEVRAWMERHRDRTEWNTGWWHNFVSPKDASFLVWTDDIPGEDVDFIMSRTGDKVKITPKIFDAWVFGFRKRHMEKIRDAARLWQLTQDPAYRDWAISQLDFYADNLEKWPIRGHANAPTRLSWQSLDEAVNLITLTDAARLLNDSITEQKRKDWYEKLFLPEVELIGNSWQTIHNIAAWHRVAVAQVALLFDNPQMLERQLNGPYGLRNQLQKGVTSDYIWYEQAIGYNDYVALALTPLFTFAGLLDKEATLREEGAILQNIILSPLRLRFADNTLPNPADSGRPMLARPRSLGAVYRILPTFIGINDRQAARGWDTLLDPPAAILAEPSANSGRASLELPPVSSALLESTRFALLKEGPWQVFFHFGQLARSHTQPEALNWSASYRGIDLSHDTGTVGYGSPMHAGYYRRSLNHNVPFINGWGALGWNPGELIEFDAGAARVSARQPLYRNDASATRTLSINGDTFTDQLQIEYLGGDERGAKLGFSLQLQGTLTLPESFRPVADFPAFIADSLKDWHATTAQRANRTASQMLGDVLTPFKYWESVRVARFNNEASLVLTLEGGERLRLDIRTDGEFEVCVGSSPDYPPLRRTGLYVQQTGGNKKATFTTTFSPLQP